VDDEAEGSGPPGFPFFAEMAKALSGQGPVSWDVARQVAVIGATGGNEPNVDPRARVSVERLAEIAARHVDSGFLSTITPPGSRAASELRVEVCGRSVWIQRTIDDHRDLFTTLARALSAPASAGVSEDDAPNDPMAAMFASFTSMLAPAMSGMAVGSMLGQLARRVFGLYDLPIPRSASEPLLVLVGNIDRFAEEWSIDPEEMRMWVLLHELHSHVVVGSPGLGVALTSAITDFVSAFRPDASALAESLGSFEALDGDPIEALGRIFSDPTTLLGAVRSPEQERLAPRVDSVVAVATGLVDRAVDDATASVLGATSRVAEAVRRRRAEASVDERFVDGLLGLRLTRDLVAAGTAFVDGVVERAGRAGLAPLLREARNVPTPSELVAPGLWLARLETQDEEIA
jgi:putative hydrolase